MTKEQIIGIEEKLNYILRRSDRLEERIEQAEADGDTDKLHRYEKKDERYFGMIEGIDFVLARIGYVTKWQDGKFVVVER